MPSITAVADQLVAADLPALFSDTCILLDVIRSIERCDADCIAKASGLLDAATVAPIRCQLIVSNIVRYEWGAHDVALTAKAARHLLKLEELSKHFHDACSVFGITPSFARANYSGYGIADQLHDLARRIVDRSLIVESDDECSGRAVQRVMHNVPPSEKGGGVKDCTILEEYLATCRQARAGGFQKRLVYCTSNTNDYCDGGALHAVLRPDFVAVGLQFTTNLGWGYYELMR